MKSSSPLNEPTIKNNQFFKTAFKYFFNWSGIPIKGNISSDTKGMWVYLSKDVYIYKYLDWLMKINLRICLFLLVTQTNKCEKLLDKINKCFSNKLQ